MSRLTVLAAALVALAAVLLLPDRQAQAQATTTVWSATLTVNHASNHFGCSTGSTQGSTDSNYDLTDCSTALSDGDSTTTNDHKFVYGNTTYTIDEVSRHGYSEYSYRLDLRFNGVTAANAKAALAGLTLNYGSTSLAINSASVQTSGSQRLRWATSLPSWSDGDTVALSLIAPAATDTTAPTVTAASTGYYSNAALSTALTGPQKSGASIYTKVTFSEDMKHTKSNGASARPELFHRIGTTDTQYDVLDNGDTLSNGDCKPNHASNTNVYVCRYTVGSSDTGAFAAKVGTNSVDKANNALASAYTHATTLTLSATTTIVTPPSGAIWSATLTTSTASLYSGCSTGSTQGSTSSTYNLTDCSSALSDDDFVYGATTYTIVEISKQQLNNEELDLRFGSGTAQAAKTALAGLTLNIGFNRGGNVHRQRFDEQAGEWLEQRAALLRGGGAAGESDRHFGADGLRHIDSDEIDMQEVLGYGMALHLADEADILVIGAIYLDRHGYVRAYLRQQPAQVTGCSLQRLGLDAGAVHMHRQYAFLAKLLDFLARHSALRQAQSLLFHLMRCSCLSVCRFAGCSRCECVSSIYDMQL